MHGQLNLLLVGSQLNQADFVLVEEFRYMSRGF